MSATLLAASQEQPQTPQTWLLRRPPRARQVRTRTKSRLLQDLKFALNVGCDVSSRCSNSNSSSSNNHSSSNDDADDETHVKSIWWYNHRLIISIIYISVMVLNDSFISLYWSTYLIVRYVCILYMSM